jgi:CubicO group peptidase (beta-lactamase class C family)
MGWAAARTKETFFAGLFARLSPKSSGKGAAWAVAHRIAKVVWLMLHKGVEYKKHGTAVANPRTLKRKLSKLLREFHRAGIDAKSLLEQSMIAAV